MAQFTVTLNIIISSFAVKAQPVLCESAFTFNNLLISVCLPKYCLHKVKIRFLNHFCHPKIRGTEPKFVFDFGSNFILIRPKLARASSMQWNAKME